MPDVHMFKFDKDVFWSNGQKRATFGNWPRESPKRRKACPRGSPRASELPRNSFLSTSGVGSESHTSDLRSSAILELGFESLGWHVCPMFAGHRIIAVLYRCGSRHLVDKGSSVSKQHRAFLLASLLPAFLLGGVFAVVQAQEGRSPAAR